MTVTVTKAWTTGGTNSRRNTVVKATGVSAGTEGATAGDLPASLFGLRHIYAVHKFMSDGEDKIPCSPSYDGESIITFENTDGAIPTAADIPADTYDIIVEGYR